MCLYLERFIEHEEPVKKVYEEALLGGGGLVIPYP